MQNWNIVEIPIENLLFHEVRILEIQDRNEQFSTNFENIHILESSNGM